MTKTIYGRRGYRITFEGIIAKMREFQVINGRWPDRNDFTNENGFPTPRSLERSRGNTFRELRRHLGIPEDHRIGGIRKKTALNALERERVYHKVVIDRLYTYFDPMRIHKESTISDDHRTRTDFKIYMKNGTYLIDLFYAKNTSSWSGCVNHKKSKYADLLYAAESNLQEVLFVCMNEDIPTEKKISDKIRVIGIKEFWKICEKHQIRGKI